MEEDIVNYLPIVMFRGTPCTLIDANRVNLKCLEHNHLKFCTKMHLIEEILLTPTTGCVTLFV